MPASYLKMRLIEFAEINPARPADVGAESNVAYVRLGTVTSNNIISPEYKSLRQLDPHVRYFQYGDILLPRIESGLRTQKIALVSINEESGFCSQEFFVIRPNAEIINPKYLYHWLRQQSCQELILLLQGTAQKRVPGEAIGQLFVNLPSRELQDLFARTMDAAAERKAICERQVVNAEKTIVGLFLEWLRKFRPPAGETIA